MGKRYNPTIEEIQKIKEMYDSGLGITTIAMRLKIKGSAVDRTVRAHCKVRTRNEGFLIGMKRPTQMCMEKKEQYESRMKANRL